MSETVARDRMFGFYGDCGDLVALERHHYEKHPEGDVVFYEVAEKLERERDEARRERDEARRDLVGAEELHRRRFQTLKAEYDAMNVELKQAIDRICQIRLERDNALATLELRVKAWSKKEEAK